MRRTRGLSRRERDRFAFLLERLQQAESAEIPCDVEAVLGGLPADVLPAVRDLLLAELMHTRDSLTSAARRVVEAFHELEAGLRQVREARRILNRTDPGMFVRVALAEVEQDLVRRIEDQGESVKDYEDLVKKCKPRGGRPSKQASSRAQALRACGLSRDAAKDLLRAVRVASSHAWPNPPEPATRLRLDPPSLLELVKRRNPAEN
jgi:hypothetical protein